jgi:hypothetical protein
MIVKTGAKENRILKTKNTKNKYMYLGAEGKRGNFIAKRIRIIRSVRYRAGER